MMRCSSGCRDTAASSAMSGTRPCSTKKGRISVGAFSPSRVRSGSDSSRVASSATRVARYALWLAPIKAYSPDAPRSTAKAASTASRSWPSARERKWRLRSSYFFFSSAMACSARSSPWER